MTADSNQFWKLLSDSGLVSDDDLHEIAALFSAAQVEIEERPEFHGLNEVETVAKWLVEQKVVTEFQADILAKGASGPFKYGNYTVVGRTISGPLKDSFSAIHRATGHPVLLQFLPGNEADDLASWQQIDALVSVVSELDSPHLATIYETVVLPSYRFVVSQRPAGKPLSVRVPRKGRIPWQDACRVVGQVGQAVKQMHQHDLSHNAISLRTIWLSSTVPAQLRIQIMPDLEFDPEDDRTVESRLDYLAPEQSDHHGSPPADIYALGCVLYRLVSGRVRPTNRAAADPPKPVSVASELAKHELPAPLTDLMDAMFSPNPNQRPDIRDALSVLGELVPLSEEKTPQPKKPASEQIFRQELGKFKPGSSPNQVKKLPEIQAKPLVSADVRATPSNRNLVRQKNNRWVFPVVTAATLALFLIGFLVYANQKVVGRLEPAASEKKPEPTEPVDATEPVEPEIDPNARWIQKLVEDDGEMLWETPTLGEPIDFSYMPPGAKLIFSLRMADLLKQDQGEFLVQSIGPRLKSKLDLWEKKTGVPLAEIEQLIISLHPVEFEYQPVFMVRTTTPKKRERLLELWNKPEPTDLETGARIYTGSDSMGYFFTEGDTDPEETRKFLIGPAALVRESADLAGAVPLEGAMKNLAAATDQDRQVSILFLRNALFNDEGQKLMSGSLSGLNRELAVTLNDSIRGGLLSLHLDNGSFLELRFDQTLDLKPSEFRNWLTESTQESLDKITQYAASSPANDYWNPVRSRYGGMMMDLYRRMRIGVEQKQVIANCWLPPMAAHNIVGGTELLLAYAGGSGEVVAPPTRSQPQTIQELLELPRDLNVTTNPDLNILLADLQAEVTDDLGELPFPFEIRLLGNDLLTEGITKNQRPGEFNMQQKTLAEILTEIMIRANPNKDITGPEDPNCKLVWVVGPDPDNAERQIVLITTRGAAAKKSYELPAAFQAE
ncbi:MAG: protein kinase [Mariniblastus sp.]|nr:protein kinase [Mariniblastus sp.]